MKGRKSFGRANKDRVILYLNNIQTCSDFLRTELHETLHMVFNKLGFRWWRNHRIINYLERILFDLVYLDCNRDYALFMYGLWKKEVYYQI